MTTAAVADPRSFFKQLDGLYAEYRSFDAEKTLTEVKFLDGLLRRLGVSAAPSMIDFCCGYGRHVLQFARNGWRGYGVDIAGGSIMQATAVADAEGLDAMFFEASCTNFEPPVRADAAMMLGTSFGIFGSLDDNLACLRTMARSVAEKGYIMLELFNPGYERQRLSGAPVARCRWTTRGVAHHEELLAGDGASKVYRVCYQRDNGERFELDTIIPLPEATYFDEALRPRGFERVSRFGDLAGMPFDDHYSARLVLVYSRSSSRADEPQR